MKILKQILEEIRPDYEVPFFETEAEGRAYMQGKAAQANEDKKIIRSHMEDDEWIPVEEQGNPKRDGTYLCTFAGELCGINEPFTGMCGYEDGEWDEPDCVLAWKPLPEPYQPATGGAIRKADRQPDHVDWFIKTVKTLASLLGLEVLGRIWVRDKETKKEYR